MSKPSAWLSRLRALFLSSKLDEEFTSEVESHLALLEEENIRRGMSPEEAHYAALRSFGGVAQVKENNRQQRGLHFLQVLLQDLRYAGRMMRKNPGFSLMAVLTLGLGVGLNTSVFSTVSGVLLKPPPVSDPDRVAMVVTTNWAHGWEQNPVSPPDFQDWRAENHSFENIAAAQAYQELPLAGDGAPEQVSAMRVSASFFSVLGVSPIEGRTFLPGEDTPGKDHVVVLSHELWEQHFGADPLVVGRNIRIGGEPYLVIGIMPSSFRLLIFPAKLWVPLVLNQDQLQPGARSSRFLHLFARLKQDVSLHSARADIEGLAQHSARDYPESNKGWGASVETLQEFMIRDLHLRASIAIMMSAVGFILLLVCANISSLLLSKIAARNREMAIRTAIGASRGRLIRQLLVESLVTSLAGGVLGLLLSFGGIAIFRMMLNSMNVVGRTLAERLSTDTNVMVFTLLLSVLTTFLFGLVPAIQGTRVNVQSALKSDERTGGGRNRLRNLLVSAEIALAVLLVTGATLLMAGIIRSLRLALGFDPSTVMTAELSLSGSKFQDNSSRVTFFRQVLAKIDAIPGISPSGAANQVAGTGAQRIPFRIQGRPEAPAGERPIARSYVVTDHYLETMGIALLRGRTFNTADNEHSAGVILVNKLFVEQFFGNEDPMGKFIKVDNETPDGSSWKQIIGVVATVKNWPEQMSDDPQMYELYWQHPLAFMELAVRATSEPGAMGNAIREAIWSVDKDQPVGRIASLTTILSEEEAGAEFSVEVFGTFAGIALLLAAMGIYGVAAYSVRQRTYEIGLRMALGAQKMDVVRLVLGGSAWLTAIGTALGIALAWPLPRVFSAVYEDFKVNAAWVYIGIPALMATIAMLACYLPARRATRIDPMIALRYE